MSGSGVKLAGVTVLERLFDDGAARLRGRCRNGGHEHGNEEGSAGEAPSSSRSGTRRGRHQEVAHTAPDAWRMYAVTTEPTLECASGSPRP